MSVEELAEEISAGAQFYEYAEDYALLGVAGIQCLGHVDLIATATYA